MLQTFKSEWKPNLVVGLTPRLLAPCIGQTCDPASECEFLVCVSAEIDVYCELRTCVHTHIRESSVILLNSLNSFISSSLHTRDCTWTSPTKPGHETREMSLAQKAVKYSIVSLNTRDRRKQT